MKVGHMVSKRFWDNSNRSITDGEMLEIEPRVNGQPLWSTTGEQRERTIDPTVGISPQTTNRPLTWWSSAQRQ